MIPILCDFQPDIDGHYWLRETCSVRKLHIDYRTLHFNFPRNWIWHSACI